VVNFTRVSDADPNSSIKVLLFGYSGAGKSYAGATAPKPAILLTERNGLQSIRSSNPDAAFVYAPTINEVRDVLKAAHNGTLRKQGFETLVIDSLTEVQRLIMDDIVAKQPQGAKWTFDEWREMTDRMRKLMRLIRNIDMHVVAIALAERSTNENGDNLHVTPSFQGKKLADEVSQYFNAVGYSFSRNATDPDGNPVTHYRVMFTGSSGYTVKGCHPLVGVVEPDVSEWFETIRSNNQG